jgi:hypothetical protein
LNACKIREEVMIGYCANLFMTHTWVKAGGRVVDDSPPAKSVSAEANITVE